MMALSDTMPSKRHGGRKADSVVQNVDSLVDDAVGAPDHVEFADFLGTIAEQRANESTSIDDVLASQDNNGSTELLRRIVETNRHLLTTIGGFSIAEALQPPPVDTIPVDENLKVIEETPDISDDIPYAAAPSVTDGEYGEGTNDQTIGPEIEDIRPTIDNQFAERKSHKQSAYKKAQAARRIKERLAVNERLSTPDSPEELAALEEESFDEWFDREIGDGMRIKPQTVESEEVAQEPKPTEEKDIKPRSNRLPKLSDPALLAAMDKSEWDKYAACAGVGSTIFFSSGRGKNYRKAREICKDCAVGSECLVYAVQTSQSNGVWSSTGNRVRSKIRKLLRSGVDWYSILDVMSETRRTVAEPSSVKQRLSALQNDDGQ